MSEEQSIYIVKTNLTNEKFHLTNNAYCRQKKHIAHGPTSIYQKLYLAINEENNDRRLFNSCSSLFLNHWGHPSNSCLSGGKWNSIHTNGCWNGQFFHDIGLWLWNCKNTTSIHHHKFKVPPKGSTIQAIPSNPWFINHNCLVPLQYITKMKYNKSSYRIKDIVTNVEGRTALRMY